MQALALDRDAGPFSVPYWRPDYRQTTLNAASLLCGLCSSANVKIGTSIAVDVTETGKGGRAENISAGGPPFAALDPDANVRIVVRGPSRKGRRRG